MCSTSVCQWLSSSSASCLEEQGHKPSFVTTAGPWGHQGFPQCRLALFAHTGRDLLGVGETMGGNKSELVCQVGSMVGLSWVSPLLVPCVGVVQTTLARWSVHGGFQSKVAIDDLGDLFQI